MLNYKLNAHGGFTSAAVAPQKCDKLLNRYYVIIPKRRSGMGGQVQSPPSSNHYFIFHSNSKRNSPEPFFWFAPLLNYSLD